uniref:Transmembrane protein 117 n=2 Tax=Clastoptera arizonana TaxID=38151 RepID=A0A1B6CIG3_9HEMI
MSARAVLKIEEGTEYEQDKIVESKDAHTDLPSVESRYQTTTFITASKHVGVGEDGNEKNINYVKKSGRIRKQNTIAGDGYELHEKYLNFLSSNVDVHRLTEESDSDVLKVPDAPASKLSDCDSCGGTSSGVGTSLVSISGFGTSRDGTGERTDHKQRHSGSDFWNQVIQQVSFIDSSGGSARSSLLVNCGQIPLGVSPSVQQNVLPAPSIHDNSPISNTTTSLTSSPVQYYPRLQRLSFRDQPNRAKLSRFYSVQQPEPETSGSGNELRVLQPLLTSSEELPFTPTSLLSRNSLATVWTGPPDLAIRRKWQKPLRTLSSANTFANATRKRKQSSWEESVSLQRRRSIASREEPREWRDRVLTNNAPPSPKEDSPPLIDKKDLRYYFQHPYLRLFSTYFTILCNFLLFAEDPISHSHAESVIPMVGNVFSFVCTKYPPEWRWALIKVLMWLLAILCGLVFGKLIVHNILCGKILRLKMFRDEQGSWIAMFLTVIISLYIFSHIYNLLIMLFYKKPHYHIDSRMGITYASVMKTAACGTWLGDLITALMVTDVMLQDNLYPEWAPAIRKIWRRSNIPRILIFWVGSVLATAVVVTLIVSDYISWDKLNRDFVASTELSRAFLASFILVMDLLIMMQDWDFPHFTTTLHINLPGFSVATLEWKYAEVHLTGKWFNYGLIFMVMLLDLNMWKNQIFYYPSKFGQYTDTYNKIHTVSDQSLLQTGNRSIWTWESRSKINETTKLPYYEDDMKMNSRYMNYPLLIKCTAVIPSVIAVSLFVTIVSLYGRFPDDPPTSNNRSHGPCHVLKEANEPVPV